MDKVFDPTTTYPAQTDDLTRPYNVEGHVGEVRRDVHGNEHVFIQASSAVTKGCVLIVDKDYKAAHITAARANLFDQVAVANAAVEANGYGWACIYGHVPAAVSKATGTHVQLYTSGTAGRLTPDQGGEKVGNFKLGTAAGAATDEAAAVIVYPTMIA